MEITTQAMMSSREIEVLTGKRHDNVCRDIRKMLVGLYGGDEKKYIRNSTLSFDINQGVSCIQYDTTNPNCWEYLLDRRHTEILITGYDVKRRAAVIDRWFQLEQSARTPQLPASPTHINSDQVKSGLALLESSCDRLALPYAAKLQAYRALQKAAGLPDLFPDAEPSPTNTKPPAPAPARQPALPLIKQPMSSLTKLLERHEIRAP
ncbi:Rha family transcriptional regulator, partial [Yersinia ruckeri]